MHEQALRVVAADDSAVIRQVWKMLFASLAEHAGQLGPGVELSAAVADGRQCLEAVRSTDPHIVLLDIEMPGMGGLEVLDLLHRERPALPIVMCSTYTERGAAATLDALARGAVDYITKPSGHSDPLSAMASLSAQLLPKIGALAARAQRSLRLQTSPVSTVVVPGAAAMKNRPAPSALQIVGIGASTGGPAALELLLPMLKEDFPAPVLIVQHMPQLFTRALAARLANTCGLPVRQAEEGDRVLAGTLLLAPGDLHMELVRSHGEVRVHLHQGPLENHTRPAVDPLFRSLAHQYGSGVAGVVLTGMGSDGLHGAQTIARSGGTLLAQDEASSAVWGMPGRVVQAGLAEPLPLTSIAARLREQARSPCKLEAIPSVSEAHYAVQR